MTKKHYEAIARMLYDTRVKCSRVQSVAVDHMTEELADYFAGENPRFDRQRFYVASGYAEARKQVKA